MKTKLSFFLAFFVGFVFAFTLGNSMASAYQALFGSSLTLQSSGGGELVLKAIPGRINLTGTAQTVSVPDETGTIITNASNYISLLQGLKAIDASKGSHSGINWQSLGT